MSFHVREVLSVITLAGLTVITCGVVDSNEDIRFLPVYISRADSTGSIEVESDTVSVTVQATGIGRMIFATDTAGKAGLSYLSESDFRQSAKSLFDSAKQVADDNAMGFILEAFPRFYAEAPSRDSIRNCLESEFRIRDRTVVTEEDTIRNQLDATVITLSVATKVSLSTKDITTVILCGDTL